MQQVGGSATQATPIKLSPTGTDVCIATYCNGYYSGSHAIHTNSGAANTGGITMMDNCKAGLCCYNGSSSESIFNTYVGNGSGQETVFWECDAKYGTLPDHRWYTANRLRGQSIQSHTSGTGGQESAFMLAWDCVHTPGEFGINANAKFKNGQVHGGTFATARCWIFGEHLKQDSSYWGEDGAVEFTGNTCSFYANCEYTTRSDDSVQGFIVNRQRGIAVNCSYDLGMEFGDVNCGLVNASNTHDGDMYFCDFIMRDYAGTGTKECRFPDRDGSSNSASWVVENCKIAFIDCTAERRIFSSVDVDNNAYVGTWDGSAKDYGSDTNSIDMTEAEAAIGYVPTSGDSLYQAGKSITPTIEVDRHWNNRDTSNHSVGSLSP